MQDEKKHSENGKLAQGVGQAFGGRRKMVSTLGGGPPSRNPAPPEHIGKKKKTWRNTGGVRDQGGIAKRGREGKSITETRKKTSRLGTGGEGVKKNCEMRKRTGGTYLDYTVNQKVLERCLSNKVLPTGFSSVERSRTRGGPIWAC